MLARHCIAVGCTADSRTSSNDVSFYQLPKVESELKKWLRLVRREGLSVDSKADNRHYVVCSKHFIDGKPTPNNPYPTMFAYNNYKMATPRKTKNSHLGRKTSETQEHSEKKRIKIVKCDSSTDKSKICYPYVAGEIDIPLTIDNNNNEIQTDVVQCQTLHHDHSYICCNPEMKYCREQGLIERIRLLEVKNKELRKENEILKSREVDFRKELLNKVLQDDKNIKHFLGLPSLSFLTFFLQFLAVFYDKVSVWKGAGRSGSKKWQEKQQNKPGDEVMADRGFQIRDLLTLKGAYLNMPPFTHEKRNGKGRVLTSKQILETRKIASLRIHVERTIRRLKSFKMLGGILPLNMKNLSSAMLRVAAAFCNFLPPLSKKFK